MKQDKILEVRTERIQALDIARFAAAVYVVVFHYFYSGFVSGKISSINSISGLVDFAKYGYLGVDLFFLISGFVISETVARHMPGSFFKSRLVRLYPAYVFSATFTAVISIYWGGDLMTVSLDQYLANLTVYKPLHGYDYVDGVYWTLMLEIKFYFIVFLLIFFGLKRLIPFLFLLWPIGLVVARISGWEGLDIFSEYYAYFCAGALFSLMKRGHKSLCILGILACAWVVIDYQIGNALERNMVREIKLSSTIVASIIISYFSLFLLLMHPKVRGVKIPTSKFLGGLTYPVYLIHAHFGYMLLSRFANEGNKYLVYMLSVVLIFFISAFIHLVVEKKMSFIWSSISEFLLSKPIDSIYTSAKSIVGGGVAKLAAFNRQN